MTSLPDVNDYLNKATERAGLTREKFVESKVPGSLSNLVIVPFFGDWRSEFIFSTMLLNRYRSLHSSTYLIVCSWPGHHGLYPYADEYWSVKDESSLVHLVRGAAGLVNEKSSSWEKTLLRLFDKIITPDDEPFVSWYDKGFTAEYLKRFNRIIYTLPSVPSVNMSFNRTFTDAKGKTVFIFPSLYINSWKHRRKELILTSEQFWIRLAKRLIEKGIKPVVYQNYMTHDLSPDLGSQCAYFNDNNIMTVIGVMRACECVLDVFTGISRLAMVARSPFVACDERQRFADLKEYEIDDLCGKSLPKKYIFSFAPIVEGGTANVLIEGVVNKLESFLPTLNRDSLPSTVEMTADLNYADVRKKDLNRLGISFFVPPKIEDRYES